PRLPHGRQEAQHAHLHGDQRQDHRRLATELDLDGADHAVGEIAYTAAMMGMTPTREWAIEELRRMVFGALGDHDAAVWLFGSCARGAILRHSDIDIGIV